MQNASSIPLVRISNISDHGARRSLEPNPSLPPPVFGRSSQLTSNQTPSHVSIVQSVSEVIPSIVNQPHPCIVSSFSKVLLPAGKATYVPNLRPPPKLQARSTHIPQPEDPRFRRKVLSKYLLVDGTVSFAVGFKSGDAIIPEPNEVPLDQILNHVTPRELERFETEEFIKEDEQEEEFLHLAAIRKPKGRPVGWRADMGLTYAQFVEWNGRHVQPVENDAEWPTEASHTPNLRLLSHTDKPISTSTTRRRPTDLDAAKSRGRGRPRVYSMVAAAGLGFEGGNQHETSREITPIPVANNASVDVGGPPSKKRRLTNPTGTASSVKSFPSKSTSSDSLTMTPLSFGRPMVVISNRRRYNSPRRTPTVQQESPANDDEVQRGNFVQSQHVNASNGFLKSPREDESIMKHSTKPPPSHSSSTRESSESSEYSQIGSTIVAEDYRPAQEKPRFLLPELEPSLAKKKNGSRLGKASSLPMAPMLSSTEIPPDSSNMNDPTQQRSPKGNNKKSLNLDHSQSHGENTNVSKNLLKATAPDANSRLSDRKRLPESLRYLTNGSNKAQTSTSTSPKTGYFSPFHTIQKYFTKRSTPQPDKSSRIYQNHSDIRPSVPSSAEAPSSRLVIIPRSLDLPQTPNKAIQPHESTEPTSPTDEIHSPMTAKQQTLASALKDTNAEVSGFESDASDSTASSVFINESIAVQPHVHDVK